MMNESRENKFRAWNKKDKRYENNHHLRIDMHGWVVNLQTGAGGNELVLEQYTGLQDKNGKEIYEGDLAKLHDYADGTHDLYEVVFGWHPASVYGFYLTEIGGGKYIMNTYCEIIGNIHENPEMLP